MFDIKEIIFFEGADFISYRHQSFIIIFLFRDEETKLYSAPPGNPMRIGDIIVLKCSILTAAAYVSLCLNDFVSAKNYATILLDEPRASSGHRLIVDLFIKNKKKVRFCLLRYLARLYLSECLLAMNKIDLALNQLDPDMVKNDNDLSFKIPVSTVDKGKKKSCMIIKICLSLIEEKPDTPETTPPIPKSKDQNYSIRMPHHQCLKKDFFAYTNSSVCLFFFHLFSKNIENVGRRSDQFDEQKSVL